MMRRMYQILVVFHAKNLAIKRLVDKMKVFFSLLDSKLIYFMGINTERQTLVNLSVT